MAVILASQSPRRKELLGLLGIPFTVRVADIDEYMDPGKPVFDEVARLSREKALAVPRQEGDTVIAADTVVVLDGSVLGKPKDPAEAVQMLTRLSGNTHEVMTGLTVLQGDRLTNHTEVTKVRFRTLTQQEIAAYVATGAPMDKAGAYGIQSDAAATFVERLEGDYYNVVGLPVCRLHQIMEDYR
ncbi:MAG: septum formation inhibitor Maf [Oscillospiraceae bacterium]|nr:septum formation inhibitor Maf [Oscillospiraceae bacterium]